MKKLLGSLLALGLLVGCGNEKASETPKEEENVAAVEKQEPTEEVAVNKDDKTSKNETGIHNGEFDITNNTGHIKLLGIFEGESSSEEDLSNTIDFNGFKVSFIPSLVDVELSAEAQTEEKYEGRTETKAIMLSMNVENTLDDDVDYNGSFTVVTDTGEQIHSESGLLSQNAVVQTYHGKVKETGYEILPLNGEELPKSIKVIMDPPDKLVDGAYNGNEDLGGEQRIEFTKLVTE
ncbi:hypothetical protein [Priestia flexa]|uniref:hypothetical protein n=1 Tax=Priestia flexa TaxID=86664 RepID=UPI003D042A84